MGTSRRQRERHFACKPVFPGTDTRRTRLLISSYLQGYVSTDMIANPPDAKAETWVNEWQDRTPAGQYVVSHRCHPP